MSKTDKFNWTVFGVFMLVTVGLTIYNVIVIGTI